MENKQLELAIGQAGFVYGYMDGKRFNIANNVEQICAFIMENRTRDIKIVNVLDMLEIETVCGFIVQCPNQWFLENELKPILVPMQLGEVDVPKYVPYVDEHYIIRNVRIKSDKEKGYFLADLDHFDGYPKIKKTSEMFETEAFLIVKYPNSINTDQAYDIATQREII